MLKKHLWVPKNKKKKDFLPCISSWKPIRVPQKKEKEKKEKEYELWAQRKVQTQWLSNEVDGFRKESKSPVADLRVAKYSQGGHKLFVELFRMLI